MEIRISRFLFKYRVTPQTTTGLSPAQLLMGRRLTTHLDLLNPDTSQTVVEKQQKLMSTEKAPQVFQLEDKLFAKNFHRSNWIPVTVTKVCRPLSYHVKTDTGITLRRHVDHLRICRTDNSIPPADQTESEDWMMIPSHPPPVSATQPSSQGAALPSANPLPSCHYTRIRTPIDIYSPSY